MLSKTAQFVRNHIPEEWMSRWMRWTLIASTFFAFGYSIHTDAQRLAIMRSELEAEITERVDGRYTKAEAEEAVKSAELIHSGLRIDIDQLKERMDRWEVLYIEQSKVVDEVVEKVEEKAEPQ